MLKLSCLIATLPALCLIAPAAFAQPSITSAPDGTGTVINHNGNTYDIDGGTQAGQNLFHSFGQFNLSAGEIANFLARPEVVNILGRIDPSQASVIDGLIRAEGQVNLFLMNPAGIVFGENARLDINGDFTATTAEQICTTAGGCFNAVGPNDFSSLGGSPTALVMLQATPGGIVNAGVLEVRKEKSLSLVGGTVVNLGELAGGNVVVAAVPGERLVRLSPAGGLLSLEVPNAVLTEGLEPLAMPELLTGALPDEMQAKVIAAPLGNVGIEGEIAAGQVDLYAAGEVTPSDPDLVEGDTRVVRFSEVGENPTAAVFIDERADSPEQLLYGAEAGTVSQLIERDEDGVAVVGEQLTAIADVVGPLESLAIVAEGNVGNFWLGSEWLTAENLGKYQVGLTQWGGALTSNADILLYSCFTALGAEGETFVNGIAGMTGVDVAASVDVTGSGGFGGNWVLEHQVGNVDAGSPFTDATLADWEGKLAVLTVQSAADDLITDGVLTFREALVAANNGVMVEGQMGTIGEDTIQFDTAGVFGSPQTITTALGEFVISDDLVIEGTGRDRLAFDGNRSNRIFNVSADNFTMQDITVQNGGGTSYVDEGSMLHTGTGDLKILNTGFSGHGLSIISSNSRTLTISGSTISSNSPATGNGLIENSGDILIDNSDFLNNEFFGELIKSDSDIRIQKTRFIGNSVRGSEMISGGMIDIGNGFFSDNNGGFNALIAGDTISIVKTYASDFFGIDGNLDLTIRDSKIIDSYTELSSDQLIISNTEILNSGGQSDNWRSSESHLINGGESTQIIDSIIVGNSNDGIIKGSGILEISNSDISENNGAAIKFNGEINISDSTISNNDGSFVFGVFSFNIAAESAGGIKNYSSEPTIVRNSSITHNSYSGIQSRSGDIFIENSSVSYNSSLFATGGIKTNSGNIYITNSDISYNISGHTSLRYGGVTGGIETEAGNIVLKKSIVSGNTGGVVGTGGVSSGSGNIVVIDSEFTNNQTTSGDPSIYSLSLPKDILSQSGRVFISKSKGVTNAGVNIDIFVNNDLQINSEGSIQLEGKIQTGGGDLLLNAHGDIDVSNLTLVTSSSFESGDISMIAGGNIDTRNLVTAPFVFGDSANVYLESGGDINTRHGQGSIDTRTVKGDSGDVSLNARGAIYAGPINTESRVGHPGSISLNSDQFISVAGTIEGSFFGNNWASLSSAGKLSGAPISIYHGGLGLVPFKIGDSSLNGTSHGITAGHGFTISPGNSFFQSYIQPGIHILTGTQSSDVITSVAGTEPINQFIDTRWLIRQIGRQAGGKTIFSDDGSFRWKLPGEKALGGSLDDNEIVQELTRLDNLLSNEFVEALELEESEESEEGEGSIANLRETLRRIREQTGTVPVLVYALIEDKKYNLAELSEEDRRLVEELELENSLELLLITPEDQLIRKVVKGVDSDTLTTTIAAFTTALKNPTNRQYRPPAQQLYTWLIAPLQAELQGLGVDTLIFAMSSGLRTIPLAALHNPQTDRFLIEDYSLGLIPSVSLTNSTYQPLHHSPIIAMGASEFGSLNDLPAVPAELQTVASHHPESQQYLNSDFTLPNLAQASQNHQAQIIHLATHARFEEAPATAAERDPRTHDSYTYIQFWQDKARFRDLRELGWYNDPQIELLVLSACETALGDPYAELGFAGLAVQTGVKSALASLWQVDDLGTLGLMSAFYDHLRDPDVTIKAEALRRAQLDLLHGQVSLQGDRIGEVLLPPELVNSQRTLTHPHYWSGFTLVGSPW